MLHIITYLQKSLSQKSDKNKLHRHITDTPLPHVDNHEQFSKPPLPPNLLHSLWMPPYEHFIHVNLHNIPIQYEPIRVDQT